MTHDEIAEAYSINTYGAVLQIEQAMNTLREGIEKSDPEASEQALSTLEDIVPTLKTAVEVRYEGDTEWIPFDTTRAGPDSSWVLEYDSDDSRRIRRRHVGDSDIPKAEVEE